MSSPRAKYPDQNGPVNLAVMPNNSPSPHSPNLSSPNNSVSPKDDRPLSMDQSVSMKDTTNLLESFNNSRLPYANNAAALASYYGPYYRYPFMSHAHHPIGRAMQRYEPYPPFLPSVPFSPQPPPHQNGPQSQQQQQQPGLGPIPISQQNGHNTHKSHVERPPLPSLLPPLNATNPMIVQQQQQHHKEMYKESSKVMSHNNNNNHNKDNNIKSLSPNSPQNHNNNNLGFKVPSGKEGSLKHRILTRPYDKDGKPQRSPPGITNGMPLNR